MPDYTARRTMMVDTQVRPSDVTEFTIIDAMLRIPRELFVPSDKTEFAYIDEQVVLEDGRVLLDPRLFAKMLEVLDLTKTDLVLDIGCGFGYSSAVIARIVEAVVALEEDDTMLREAETLLSDQGADNVVLQSGALDQGAKDLGPYDAIILQGGVETLPDQVLAQLKDGGRIACLFMKGPVGSVKIGYKLDGAVSWRFAFNGAAPVLAGFEAKPEFVL